MIEEPHTGDPGPTRATEPYREGKKYVLLSINIRTDKYKLKLCVPLGENSTWFS
jgi:hypothetical protein